MQLKQGIKLARKLKINEKVEESVKNSEVMKKIVMVGGFDEEIDENIKAP